MEKELITVGAFMAHLRAQAAPLAVRRAGPPVWDDAAMHRAVYDHDPELYALLALTESATAGQRQRILYQVLERSRAALAPAARQTLDRVAGLLLAALHPDLVLAVFLALRRARANHKHTAHAILGYILNHPHLDDLVRRRRPAVADALEHALGKNVARGAVRMLGEPGAEAAAYVRRHLLRFARDPARVRASLPALYTRAGETAPVPAGEGPVYTRAYEACRDVLDHGEARPKTVTATNRGDIAATLVHLYRGGPSPELAAALDRYVDEAAVRLPRFPGRLAVVLDASASTQGYGEREFCGIAQSVALERVLAATCAHLRTYPVGGVGPLHTPDGPTDLASALLDAVAEGPDVIAIVSDGYENVYGGDLARVAATLPAIGVRTPVVFCHSKFSYSDDLSLRRPAPALPQREFWHQADFEDLLLYLFTLGQGEPGDASLRAFLHRKLDYIEKEVSAWSFTS